MPFPPPKPQQHDGNVDSYQRVVNGKVVSVNSYAKRSSASTTAAKAVRKIPGRPRMAANPGTYSSGRDLPGVQAHPLPPQPAPQIPGKEGPNVQRPPQG